MKPSFALVLFAFAAASVVATACTERHRLGGRYDDGATGEGGAPDTPSQDAGAAPATGGSGSAATGGSSHGAAGDGGGSGGSAGNVAAGASGYAQQPDPNVLL